MSNKKYNWTERDIEILKEKYYDCDLIAMSIELNKTLFSIYKKASYLKIKRNPKFALKGLKDGNVKGLVYRYPKGHIPANKGKKMPEEIYEKCKNTMFQKGHTPHNAKYDGYERITVDGYVEVRVAKGKFVLKHRLVWEENFGPIPKGMIIIFKDKNRQNCDINNLALIDRKSGMAMNTIHRYPEELKTNIRLLGKLKKVINEKQA